MGESLAYDPTMKTERDTTDEPQPDDENGRDIDPLDEALEETFPASDPIASEGPGR
jgi:hypothetical protein